MGGLERTFSESPRELTDDNNKCFLVILPDTKEIKFRKEDMGRISSLEFGMVRTVYLENMVCDDEYVHVPISTGTRFVNVVLTPDYIATCPKKKYIIGKKKTEDGSSEFEDRVEVDISEDAVSAKDSDVFTGEKFLIVTTAMMPAVVIVPS